VERSDAWEITTACGLAMTEPGIRTFTRLAAVALYRLFGTLGIFDIAFEAG
jgi:hypothetical protein